ncbi:hypothetical protein H0H93_003679 [Arthromyces matolae]|nr:hypothetical protein H0H93_003679 [Arthromyces matolae]
MSAHATSKNSLRELDENTFYYYDTLREDYGIEDDDTDDEYGYLTGGDDEDDSMDMDDKDEEDNDEFFDHNPSSMIDLLAPSRNPNLPAPSRVAPTIDDVPPLSTATSLPAPSMTPSSLTPNLSETSSNAICTPSTGSAKSLSKVSRLIQHACLARNQIKASNTHKRYELILKEIRLFILHLLEHPDQLLDLDPNFDLVRDLAAFKECLDNPNKYSALVADLFLSEKCWVKKCKHGTAVQIRSALIWHWNQVHDGYYNRKYYEYNKQTDQVLGNPARAPAFNDNVKAIEKAGRHDAPRKATPVKIEDMKAMYEASLRVVSQDALLHAINNPPKDAHLRYTILHHARMRAMITLGFNLLPRYHELAGLCGHNVHRKTQATAPHHPYFEVTFDKRKGKDINDPDLECHPYNLYARDIPWIDAYTPLDLWLKLLRTILGRDLGDDEKLFPHINTQAVLQMDHELSIDQVSSLITQFAELAGIKKRFTTHSLRRGGAQYVYIDAPPGHRWSLAALRWWGAWSAKEPIKMLIRYLLNEIDEMEKSYSDQLNPCNWPRSENDNRQGSLLGEATDVRGPSKQDFYNFTTSMMQNMQTMVSQITSLETRVTSMASHLSTQLASSIPPHPIYYPSPIYGMQYPPHMYPHSAIAVPPNHAHGSPFSDNPGFARRIPQPPSLANSSTAAAPAHVRSAKSTTQNVFRRQSSASQSSFLASSDSIESVSNPKPHESLPAFPYPQRASTNNRHEDPFLVQGISSSSYSPATEIKSSQIESAMSSQSNTHNQSAPHYLRIPPVGKGKGQWRSYVEQWRNIDAQTGFALKDWPKEWYTGDHVSFQQSYQSRKLIGEAYENLGGTDKKFREAFEGVDGWTYQELKVAIKQRFKITVKQRHSHNGSPNTRTQKRAREQNGTPNQRAEKHAKKNKENISVAKGSRER